MKKMKSFLCLTLSLALLITFFSGCSRADAKSSSEASGQASGKNLVFAQTQTYSTLDPVHSYDGWFTVRFGVGETLTKFDDNMQAEGWLAEDDYSVSGDGLTWTFTIKDTVTFSNGTKLTAALAKDSIQRVFDESERAMDFFELKSMEADGQTLKITTGKPCPTLPSMLADPLFVMIDTSAGTEKIRDNGPVCTGPFIYKSFDPVSLETTVIKNKNYWDGDVKLDSVKYIQFSDTTAMSLSFQNGEADAAYGISPTDISTFANDDSYTVIKEVGARTDWGLMNQNGLLKDKNLRIALLECLDMETICSVQLNNMYEPGNTPFPTKNYGVSDLQKPYSYNPKDAAARLQKAGYKDTDADGILENASGEPVILELYTYTTRAELPTICEALQAAAKDSGIQININTADDLWSSVIPTGNYDLAVFNCSAISTGDPESFLKQYFVTDGVYNKYGYSNNALDTLVSKLSGTTDQEKRNNLVKEISQIMMDDACCGFYSYPMMSIISRKNVTGLKCTMADYYWMNADADMK